MATTRSWLPACRLAARTTSVSPIAEAALATEPEYPKLRVDGQDPPGVGGVPDRGQRTAEIWIGAEHLGRGPIAGHVAAAVGGHELVVLALGDPSSQNGHKPTSSVG